MTQNQLEWMQERGLDPAQYDMTPDGRVIRRQAAEPVQPQREVMSAPRAFGTSFLGSVLPSAAGLYAGAQAGALGGSLAGPVGSVLGAIGGGLAGGYGAGKLQEAALERFAPEAVAEMQRAQTDQPVFSYLGGFAPNALALRPSLGGLKGLTAPLMSMERDAMRAAFTPAAVNVGANVAGATAGQLVDLAQGGEFSAPRFAADVALGSLFSDPTRIGRRLGLQPLTPETAAPERLDLAGRRGELAAAEAARADEAASARATELLGGEQPRRTESFGPDARRFDLAENQRVVNEAFDKLGLEKNPEIIQDFINDPMLSNFRDDPAAVLDYVSEKTGLKARSEAETAATEARRQSEAFEAEYAGKPIETEVKPLQEQIVTDGRRTEVAENRRAIEETLTKFRGQKLPPEVVQDLANDPFIGNVRDNPEAFNEFVLEKADQYLQRAYAQPFAQIERAAKRMESGLERAGAKLREGETARELLETAEKGGSAPEIMAARQIYEDVYARLQRGGSEGQITQADLDAASKIAARRGLKIELDRVFTDDGQEALGMYFVDEGGNRIIRINPFEATPETAIHEIGHDVFVRSAGERMKKSLMQTAEDSMAFKAEYEARLKEGVNEQTARDLALEEGVVQAFGEKYPNVPQGEIRSWFNALKASLKSMVGMKLSPEDAARWLHYATTEAVPWKGAVAVKQGEERMQRAPVDEASYLKAVEAGDMETAQRMVDQAAKAAGYDIGPVYHGTKESFNVFDEFEAPEGFHFGTKAAAETFGPSKPYYLRGKIKDVKDMGRSWETDLPVRDEVYRYTNKYEDVGSKSYMVGDPENIKLAETVTRDDAGNIIPLSKRFQAESPDIRYQRGLGSEIKTPSELDYLTSKGGPFAEVAGSLKAAYNTRDYKQGQWSSKYSLTTKLPEEARVRLLNHLAGEFDSGVLKAPAPDIKAAYDQIRKDYLPAIVNDYNSKGFMVRDTAGLRARGSNPTYFPLHAVADEVKTILTTKQGSPEYTKLENDFKQWNTQLRQADGASLAEAQRYANEKFADMQNIVAKPPGIESGVSFAGARKPEGYPLPPSWRSDDIIDILNNYTRRSATDYAYQSHVESSPVAMAALGAKTMLNNQPIPLAIQQSTPNIVTDPSVQSVLREYRGTPAQKTEGLLQSAGRLTSAATIGTVSKVGDIGTSMFKGLAYLPGSEYAAGLSQFVNKIADWAALKERSYASGLNKRDAAENMRQVFGIAEDSTAFMDKAARVLSKVTFVNDLESVARVIAQGWGETVVGINKKLALGGDKNALQMLDTLSPDWRTRSDADLAAQVGRLLQGSYDMRQLPASVLEGAAAPYLTWSKWSIGQYDSFVKYAIRPAMQGNMKPLIGQMLIGLMGGGAVSAVQEWLNNREGKDITWKELEAWMQQNQGELGSDGGVLLGQKLLTMAQKMGTFGFAGDLTKMIVDAAAGGSAQGVATMPAVDAIYDVSKRTAAAIKALDDGEDFGLVMKALMKDSLVGHVQALRVARNWLDEDENLRYDDRRRQRLYDALSGLPSKGGAFSVNYSNLSEREFERGEITPETGEEAMSLIRRAREQATTPEDYASRIRKLKTSQNQIMPSLERQPMKAARYLSWLEGTEEELGSETMRRYMIRKQEDNYRKSLVEGLSGLR